MNEFNIETVLIQTVIPIAAGLGFIVYLVGALILQYWRLGEKSTSKPTKIFIACYVVYIMAIGICLQVIFYDIFPQCILPFIVLSGVVSWATWSMVEGSKKRHNQTENMREQLIKRKKRDMMKK